MKDDKNSHPIAKALFVVFLIVFFGGGLLLFVNLLVPFLPEAAFAITALIIGAMMVVLAVVGKCVEVIRTLRRAARPSWTGESQPPDGSRNRGKA